LQDAWLPQIRLSRMPSIATLLFSKK